METQVKRKTKKIKWRKSWNELTGFTPHLPVLDWGESCVHRLKKEQRNRKYSRLNTILRRVYFLMSISHCLRNRPFCLHMDGCFVLIKIRKAWRNQANKIRALLIVAPVRSPKFKGYTLFFAFLVKWDDQLDRQIKLHKFRELRYMKIMTSILIFHWSVWWGIPSSARMSRNSVGF